jgi:hypothetical protein
VSSLLIDSEKNPSNAKLAKRTEHEKSTTMTMATRLSLLVVVATTIASSIVGSVGAIELTPDNWMSETAGTCHI